MIPQTTSETSITSINDDFIYNDECEFDDSIAETIEPVKEIKVEKKSVLLTRLSFYNPCDPFQTDDSPCIFADGTKFKPEEEYVIAVSPDLKKRGYTFGKKVRLEGLPDHIPKEWIILDVTNRRYTDTADIAYWIKEESPAIEKMKAIQLGVYKDIRLCLL